MSSTLDVHNYFLLINTLFVTEKKEREKKYFLTGKERRNVISQKKGLNYTFVFYVFVNFTTNYEIYPSCQSTFKISPIIPPNF